MQWSRPGFIAGLPPLWILVLTANVLQLGGTKADTPPTASDANPARRVSIAPPISPSVCSDASNVLLCCLPLGRAGLDASEVDVGPARPYQEQLPLNRGGVSKAGATGGAPAAPNANEPDESSYLPNARHWMAGPLKKKDGDHYRQGFNKVRCAPVEFQHSLSNL